MRVLDERRTLDDAMALTTAFDGLEGADRSFARAMASAALRHLGRINSGLAPLLSRPLDTATPPSRALLQIGAAQIWVLGTPHHAAVGETVAAAKLWPRARQAAGFLNAVLRKVASDRSTFEAASPTEVWPGWLAEIFREGLGSDAAEDLAAAQLTEPDLHLTPRSEDGADLAEAIGGAILPSGSVHVPRQSVEKIPGYADGTWWVQDQAATLPARLLGVTAGETVVDLCAAPGGKTLQLASTGARVFAVDRSAKRLLRVEENLARTKLSERVELIAANGDVWRPDAPVDAVLVDAPCSALGTLRRHPEGAWIKGPEEIARYPEVQIRLLRAALSMLKPGGRLVYCVCSPLPAEGREVVQTLLAEGGCHRLPILASDVPGFADKITPDGDLLTLPNATAAHDAFFIARLASGA